MPYSENILERPERPVAPVSVVVPFHNRNDHLPDVLATIDAQTVAPERIILVDDGSFPPLPDPGRDDVMLVRHAGNRGAAAARNTGVAAATTPFVAFLDSDDRWHPTKLERQMSALEAADDAVFGVLSGYRRVGKGVRGRVVHAPQVGNWLDHFLLGIRCAPGSTLIFRKETFEEIGGFDTRLRRFEDWDLLLKAARSSRPRFLAIPQVLADIILSGRPDAGDVLSALEMMERLHMPRLRTPRHRRLFTAALQFERAAAAKWQRRYGRMTWHLLLSFRSPELLRREMDFTLGKQRSLLGCVYNYRIQIMAPHRHSME